MHEKHKKKRKKIYIYINTILKYTRQKSDAEASPSRTKEMISTMTRAELEFTITERLRGVFEELGELKRIRGV